MTALDTTAETIVKSIDRWATLTLKKRPALASVVKPFAYIFSEIAVLVDSLGPELEVDDLTFEEDRLSSGVPLLSDVARTRLEKPLRLSFERLNPALNHSFPSMASEFDRVRVVYKRGTLNLSDLAEDYLHQDADHFKSAALENGLSPAGLGFVINFSLSAVLQALAPLLVPRVQPSAWKYGYCPICGFYPSISYLAKPSAEISSLLKGGGGEKYLHCALCGHDWRFSRHACPVCGNEDQGQRFYLEADDETTERVDICRKCETYLLCLDSRPFYDPPHPDLAAISLLHLEILARKEGFQPMTWTPWNRFE